MAKKLKLDALKVTSFNTTLEVKEEDKVRGGVTGPKCSEVATYCNTYCATQCLGTCGQETCEPRICM